MRAAGGREAAASSIPFPWDEAITLGLARLRLTPDHFWALTPAELLLMAGLGGHAPAVLDRRAFARLLERVEGAANSDPELR